MKNKYLQKILLFVIAVTASMFFAQYSLAADTSGSKSSPEASKAAVTSRTAPELSYGMAQVLQLSHAKISDSTIIAYIRNSGTVYKLDASQIVFLKKQGISDAVITAMINHGSSAVAALAQKTAQSKTATVVAPPATAYVVPYPQSYYYSPYYYPYDYYWWQYPPVVSFSFGFGGGYHGGYHGGFHGGGHDGFRGGGHGGFHGGGGHRR